MFDHWNVPAFDFDPSGEYRGAIPYCVDPKRSNELKYHNAHHVKPGVHSTDLFADASVEFLRDHTGAQPFFMYVSFMAPHDPRTMPKKYVDMYDPAAIALPESFLGGHPFDNGELHIRDEMLAAFPRDPAEIRRHIAEYYAMITHVDDAIARVLAALEQTGHAEDTIVVFSGDNGLALGRHGLMGKQNVYDHSVRVPLLFSGPGIPADERRTSFCYLADIFPTLCELSGIELPASVEGRSLVGAMREDAPGREELYLAYRGVQRAVRDERWKLVEYVVDGARTTQLFDLENDPWELDNLAGQSASAAEVERLRASLTRQHDELGDTQEQMGAAFWGGMASC
jgi:arylsulfatase A-like enzyme